ncbi:hypothetical protein HNV08_05580 [Winogradskyella eckloniae]|uniref:hypothetical protein n=1 Tax=Winogradskyella eckloniae TaxID=1089306 RepID=UPI001565C81D|nr:hypothetical protein [Winogradskyella eckloniae]NRD19509.1 hypothetical protein [Winogradskyella eckloniae]
MRQGIGHINLNELHEIAFINTNYMDTTINLRLGADVKLQLEELASYNIQTLSQYLRELLTDHVLDHNEVDDEFFIDIPDSVEIFKSNEQKPKRYEQSYDFTYLLTWIFYKSMNPQDFNNKTLLTSIKNRVELVINESSFSQELKLEFVKILNDLNRFLVEPNYEHKQFFFSTTNHPLSFDYFRLMDEIWAIKY